MVTEINHSTWGPLLRHGALWEMSRSELVLGPPPVMAEHTLNILSELDYESNTIMQLSKKGIVVVAD